MTRLITDAVSCSDSLATKLKNTSSRIILTQILCEIFYRKKRVEEVKEMKIMIEFITKGTFNLFLYDLWCVTWYLLLDGLYEITGSPLRLSNNVFLTSSSFSVLDDQSSYTENATCEVTSRYREKTETKDATIIGDRYGDKKLINIIFCSGVADEFHAKLLSVRHKCPRSAKKRNERERQISSWLKKISRRDRFHYDVGFLSSRRQNTAWVRLPSCINCKIYASQQKGSCGRARSIQS